MDLANDKQFIPLTQEKRTSMFLVSFFFLNLTSLKLENCEIPLDQHWEEESGSNSQRIVSYFITRG